MAVRPGDTRGAYERVFDVYWPIGLAVFVVIVVLVVLVVLRFRSSSDEFPEGTDERRPLELGYMALVALAVAGLLALTLTTMSDTQAANEGAEGPLVEVTAAKWNWRFAYPEAGVSRAPNEGPRATLVVPADTPVRFRLRSRDVIHSFWIPRVRFKRDAVPHTTTSFVLRFPEEGRFQRAGVCNQFCGLLHSDMTFDVRVLAPDRFAAWLRTLRGGRDAA